MKIVRTRVDGQIEPYDPAIFSPNTAGAMGRCSFANQGRQYERCGPPVVAQYRRRVRDRSGLPGGAWYALCETCAKRSRYLGVEITIPTSDTP